MDFNRMPLQRISKQDRDLAVKLCDEGNLPEPVFDLFWYISMAWSWKTPVEDEFYRAFKKFVSQYAVD